MEMGVRILCLKKGNEIQLSKIEPNGCRFKKKVFEVELRKSGSMFDLI